MYLWRIEAHGLWLPPKGFDMWTGVTFILIAIHLVCVEIAVTGSGATSGVGVLPWQGHAILAGALYVWDNSLTSASNPLVMVLLWALEESVLGILPWEQRRIIAMRMFLQVPTRGIASRDYLLMMGTLAFAILPSQAMLPIAVGGGVVVGVGYAFALAARGG
jgi:hypothetical protein